MSHQTFKVSIVIDDTVENFYIKHFIDDFQPVFQKFKSLVFQRNPAVNVPSLKIYWIDAENDKILISCEEDFRLYVEQGAGRKVFFNVRNDSPQPEDPEDVAMDAEESIDRSKAERRARKSLIRDEEKQKRAARKLAEKMKTAEEKLIKESERRSRNPEKYERKNAERLERAKKRCEQIRQIIGSIDPANLSPGFNVGATTSASVGPTGSGGLGASASASANIGVSTSTQADDSIDESLAILHPSAETIRLLSNAIAGCLQPCNLINKILNEIIGMVPQPTVEPTPSNDQQQQTEVTPQASAATNTSNAYTPVVPTNPSSQEIEALFKEAAKELEKMNEIVNNSRSGSLSSSMTGTTQIERVFSNINDSAISNATIVNNEDAVDACQCSPSYDFNDFKVVTPPKSMRSRESSIEVHDATSMMSDDSREWTILDAANEPEDESLVSEKSLPGASGSTQDPVQAASMSSSQNASEKFISEERKDSIKSVETQTPPLVLESSSMSQQQVEAIKASIESVEKMNDIVKTSIASAQQSLQSIPAPVVPKPELSQPISIPVLRQGPVVVPLATPQRQASVESSASFTPPRQNSTETSGSLTPKPKVSQGSTPAQNPFANLATTPANLMANRLSSGAVQRTVQPAVIVYDPNPKINAAVHQMINMGFTNEGGWLTQLLLNVDGDVPKAINFLTPQPKPSGTKTVLKFD